MFIRHFPRHASATLKRHGNGIFIGVSVRRIDVPQSDTGRHQRLRKLAPA
jgi:hypothetical protein